MNSSNARAAVIGAGHMGRYHVAAYTEIHNIDVVGVVDTDPERAKAAAEPFGYSTFADYKELFGKVDLVSIAVPTSQHFEVAKDFLEAGVNVLVEKPIAPTLAEAEEMFEIAAANHVVLHVGHVERFNGAVQEMKKILEDPILIECRRLGPYTARINDAGVVMDLMIHDIDIVQNLVGSPVVEVQAMGRSVVSDFEDFVSAQLMFESGCVANIIASRISENKIRTLGVSQKEMYVSLDYTDQEIHIHRQSSSSVQMTHEHLRYRQEEIIERIFVHKANPLKLEIQHFHDCAIKHKEPMVTTESELRSLKIALKVLEQIRPNGK
jgi:predicted dehydrogenase